MAKLSPVFNDQTVDVNGDPATGDKLFTYVAGSSTKTPVYTNEAGTIAHTNPIIFDSLGFPTQGPIWIPEGTEIKFVWAPATDTDPPTSPIKTIDNVSGVGDNTVSVSQWISSGLTPTYISANSFTLQGDQTSEFHLYRRLQFTVGAGTVYGNITGSVFAASVTTVTMQMDAGMVLDAGLSVVNLSILRADFLAVPSGFNQSFAMVGASIITAKGVSIPGAATTAVFSNTDGDVVDISGTGWTCTSLGTAPQAGDTIEGTITGSGTFVQSANLQLNIGTNAVFNGTTTATNLLTVNSITSGTIAIGDQIAGTGITSGGVVTAYISGTGGVGTYSVTTTQNVGPIAMTATKSLAVSTGDKYRAIANTTSQIDVIITKKSGNQTIAPPQTSVLVSGTAVASTSGISIPFNNIPPWVKRITVMLAGVSTNGTSGILIQIGDSGGIENTAYAGGATFAVNASPSAGQISTTGFIIAAIAATISHGTIILNLVDAATNTWVASGSIGQSNTTSSAAFGGSKSLSATLDRLVIASANGVDTFDGGLINIAYE